MHPETAAAAFSGMSLWSLLEARASARPEKAFIIWQPFDKSSVAVSFSAMLGHSLRFAGWLSRHNVGEGSRVLVHLENCPEFLITLFACARLGATAVTTNTRLTNDELASIVGAVQPTIVVTQPRYLASFAATAPSAEVLVVTETDAGSEAAFEVAHSGPIASFSDCLAAAFDVPVHQPEPTRDLLIQFTSGTTSRAKGVVLTHANLLWTARMSAFHEGLRSDDTHLVSLPLFHVNALHYGVLASLWAGASVVLTPRFSSSRFWDIALRHKCTWASQTGFTHKALLAGPTPQRHFFRFWGNGVCDIPEDRITGIPTLGWWGMTETVTHGIVGAHDLPNRPWSMGRPSPGYDVYVVDDDGKPVRAEQPGRLLIGGQRGLSLFDRYLDDDEATRSAFDCQGRFITGDIVVRHSDGFLSFVEREKDMLKVGGENVAASEIERVISGIAGVSEVAVVGKPHAMLEEVPVAFIVAAPEVLPSAIGSEISRRCEEMLADFKRPREVRFLDALPKGTLDKVSKKSLRTLALEEEA